jgi:hypothetical protein
MAVPALLNQVAGYMAKLEAAYGTAETLTAGSDGVYPYIGDGLPDPPTELEYLFDGNIGNDVRTLFPTLRAAPNGRGRSQQFKVFFKGAADTYTALIKPPREVDLFLQAAGFTAAFSVDEWLYSPTAAGTTYKSVTLGTYAQGKAHVMAGGLADWGFTFDDLGVPIHTFDFKGIGAVPTTLTLPTITYQNTAVIPPVSAGVVVTIGDWVAPIVKGGSFKSGRDLGNARARITEAGGHLGFVPGRMMPELNLMVEQTALVGTPYHTTGGLDPDVLREAATAIDITLQFGTVSGNRWKVTLNDAQLSSTKPANDDAVAMWDLTFKPTTATAVTVLFD